MKIKCIGGLANGEIIDVSYKIREGDQIRVPAKIIFEISNFEEELIAFRENKTPRSVVVPYYYYQVACIHWKDEYNESEIYFLHPIKWNKFEALAYIIGT